jgi:hypothetical protein
LNVAAYQTVPVSCPNCNHRFASPVLTIIDADQSPEAKALLLAGRLNVAVCPQCGHAGMLSAPLVYHDPEKEILFTYVPSELGLSEVEQQRFIGDLTSRTMSALPPEQRKGYLLRPRTFLRLEGLIEAILEADGITPEMLESQRTRANLLERLLQATSEDARQAVARENDALIDYDFFELLTLNIELAEADSRQQIAQELLGLRRQLLEWATVGREVASREEAIKELGSHLTREELLEKLVGAALAGERAKVEAMVAFARPAIDYIFYQQLTARIEASQEAGDADQAEALKALRNEILEMTAEIDAEIQKASEQATQVLNEILQSNDIERAVRANIGQIDDLFFNAFAMRLNAAEQSSRSEDVEKLRQLGDVLLELIKESQPPQIRFINELLGAKYPDGTQALLEENRQQIDTELLEVMRLLGEDLTNTGRGEVAQRLAEIRQQAAAMVG